MVQELAQARLQVAFGNSSAQLTVRSYPLPVTPREAERIETILTILAAMFVLVPFCYLAGTFGVLCGERTSREGQAPSGGAFKAIKLLASEWLNAAARIIPYSYSCRGHSRCSRCMQYLVLLFVGSVVPDMKAC